MFLFKMNPICVVSTHDNTTSSFSYFSFPGLAANKAEKNHTYVMMPLKMMFCTNVYKIISVLAIIVTATYIAKQQHVLFKIV